jgi:hypothetical protein
MNEQTKLDAPQNEQAPQCVEERYLPEENAEHTLVRTAGKMQMWRSSVDRSARALPPHVRFHILDGREVEALLMPERIALRNWDLLTA